MVKNRDLAGKNILELDENLETFYNEEMQSYLVKVQSSKQVEEFTPDFNKLLQYSKKTGELAVVVTAKGEGEFDYVYRTFAPLMGIDEDPGTGIVNCMIGHYWGEVLGKKVMKVNQPSLRGSKFTVEIVENGVRITGKATPLIKGIISI